MSQGQAAGERKGWVEQAGPGDNRQPKLCSSGASNRCSGSRQCKMLISCWLLLAVGYQVGPAGWPRLQDAGGFWLKV